MAEQQDANVAVVRRYFDAYNQSNEEVMAELVTDDYLDYGHAEPGKGVEGAKDDLRGLLSAFDQVNYAINATVAMGDNVGVYWTGTMRHVHDAFGFKATNKQVSYNGVSIYKLRDGKIAETRNVQDLDSIFRQIQES